MLTEISVSSPARKNINYYLENEKKKKKSDQRGNEKVRNMLLSFHWYCSLRCWNRCVVLLLLVQTEV